MILNSNYRVSILLQVYIIKRFKYFIFKCDILGCVCVCVCGGGGGGPINYIGFWKIVFLFCHIVSVKQHFFFYHAR